MRVSREQAAAAGRFRERGFDGVGVALSASSPLAGAMTLARAVDDPELSGRILRAATAAPAGTRLPGV